MATSFPSSLDSFTNPSATDALDSVSVPHADQHADLNDAVEALQAKVGVDGSAVTSSLDYQLANFTNKLGSGAAVEVPGTFAGGDTLQAAEMNALPAGHLAIQETTGDITINTTDQIVLTISFTLSASRRVYLLGYLPRVDNASTSLQAFAYISTSTTALTSVYQLSYQGMTTGDISQIYIHRDVGLAAGSYTFYLWAGTNTGTARINGASGFRRSGLVAFDMGDN